ncbi:hypothetical protein IWQ61_000218 [Dispira simplex]|nr:hypothetical protein IWQ61_000218 [Dispira simplex]
MAVPDNSPTTSPNDRPASPPPPLPGDCLSCKIVGAGAFGGMGAFALNEARKLPSSLYARRMTLLTIGGGK